MKQLPLGIRVIATLYYFLAGLALFALISSLGTLFWVESTVSAIPGGLSGGEPAPVLSLFGLASSMEVGIAFYIFVILSGAIVGIGLWKGKNWSRIAAIVLMSIGAVYSVYEIIKGNFTYLIGVVVGGLLIGYLLFSPRAKEFFSQ